MLRYHARRVPCTKALLQSSNWWHFLNSSQCLSVSNTKTSLACELSGRDVCCWCWATDRAIVSEFLHTPQVISRSLCLPFCLIIYHTEGNICQRRGPVFRDYRAKHSSPSGSPRLEANEDSLLQSRGAYYLSKVPSIWRVPPPLPGHKLDLPSHDGRSCSERHGRLSVAVLGWARRSYAVHVDCPPLHDRRPRA